MASFAAFIGLWLILGLPVVLWFGHSILVEMEQEPEDHGHFQ